MPREFHHPSFTNRRSPSSNASPSSTAPPPQGSAPQTPVRSGTRETQRREDPVNSGFAPQTPAPATPTRRRQDVGTTLSITSPTPNGPTVASLSHTVTISSLEEVLLLAAALFPQFATNSAFSHAVDEARAQSQAPPAAASSGISSVSVPESAAAHAQDINLRGSRLDGPTAAASATPRSGRGASSGHGAGASSTSSARASHSAPATPLVSGSARVSAAGAAASRRSPVTGPSAPVTGSSALGTGSSALGTGSSGHLSGSSTSVVGSSHPAPSIPPSVAVVYLTVKDYIPLHPDALPQVQPERRRKIYVLIGGQCSGVFPLWQDILDRAKDGWFISEGRLNWPDAYSAYKWAYNRRYIFIEPETNGIFDNNRFVMRPLPPGIDQVPLDLSVTEPDELVVPVNALKYYVVFEGEEPGIWTNWLEAGLRTQRVLKNAEWKAVSTRREAISLYLRKFNEGKVKAHPIPYGRFDKRVTLPPFPRHR